MKQLLLIALVLFVTNINAQFENSTLYVTRHPCPIDTVKGVLYRSSHYGNNIVDTGYYIAPCGGIQIGNLEYYDGEKSIKYPTWIPGTFLRNDSVDNKGKLLRENWDERFNSGYFTDKHFKRLNITSIYGLIAFQK